MRIPVQSLANQLFLRLTAHHKLDTRGDVRGKIETRLQSNSDFRFRQRNDEFPK